MADDLLASKRKDWIDALRAIAMILVVYGHQVPEWNEYFVFTSPIKICLFFAISGYLLNTNKGWKEFLISIVRQLIVPWVVLSLIQPILLIPFRGIDSVISELLSILTGQAKWYMPCCVIAEILWYSFNRLFKGRKAPILLMCYISFGVGMLLCRHEVLDIWMINRALTVQPYLLIGAVYKLYEAQIKNKARSIFVVSAFVYIGLGVVSILVYPGASLDVHTASYYNLIICHIMIWTGITTMFILFEYGIRKYQRWIITVGRDTLVIYMFHSLLITVIVKAAALIGISVTRILALLVTVVVCAICCFISFLINRYCPVILGGRKIKHLAD